MALLRNTPFSDFLFTEPAHKSLGQHALFENQKDLCIFMAQELGTSASNIANTALRLQASVSQDLSRNAVQNKKILDDLYRKYMSLVLKRLRQRYMRAKKIFEIEQTQESIHEEVRQRFKKAFSKTYTLRVSILSQEPVSKSAIQELAEQVVTRTVTVAEAIDMIRKKQFKPARQNKRSADNFCHHKEAV